MFLPRGPSQKPSQSQIWLLLKKSLYLLWMQLLRPFRCSCAEMPLTSRSSTSCSEETYKDLEDIHQECCKQCGTLVMKKQAGQCSNCVIFSQTDTLPGQSLVHLRKSGDHSVFSKKSYFEHFYYTWNFVGFPTGRPRGGCFQSSWAVVGS